MRKDPKVISRMLAPRTLDVGGWHKPLLAATHVIDINPYETRLVGQAIDPENQQRYSQETWFSFDICNHEPWPFPDKFFDFSTCSHVLEDVRDPIWVASELSRVSKAGYIECPSAASELLASVDFATFILGSAPSLIGNAHHRWFVEMKAEDIIFRFKPHDLPQQRRFVPFTRLHRVDWEVIWHFWEGRLNAREEIFDLGEYVDSIMSKARQLAHFEPVARVRDKINRTGTPPSYEQPQHGDGIKYPYL